MKAKREQAADWITWASWAAMATAAWAGFALLAIFAGDTAPTRDEYLLIFGIATAAFVQGAVGWSLGRTRSQWNAWVLMTFYALGLVLSFLNTGFANVPFRIGIGVIYVLGFMGTVQYEEMDRAIHDYASRPTSEGSVHAG